MLKIVSAPQLKQRHRFDLPVVMFLKAESRLLVPSRVLLPPKRSQERRPIATEELGARYLGMAG